MMCQEVIELMQRYLDQDLNETEYRRMLMHIQSCSGCAELFERLVGLSQELESLPKVTPPVSIVDSILPRLEQLDRMAAEGTAAAADTGKRGAALTWRARMKEWISLPMAGGVVAAGLVLGFFVFSQQQSTSQDGSQILFTLGDGARSEKTAATSNAGSASQKRADAPAAASKPLESTDHQAAAAETAPMANADENKIHMDQKVNTENVIPGNQAQLQTPQSQLAPGGQTKTSPNQPFTLQQQPQQQMSSPSTGPTAAPKEPAAETQGQAPSQGSSNASGGTAVQTAPPATNSGGTAQTPTESTAKPPEDSAGIMNMRPIAPTAPRFGLGEPYSPQEAPSAQAKAAPSNTDSPGGEYSAFLDGFGHVAIRSSATGQVAFTSKQQWAADQITWIGWSADLQFTYEVKLPNQTKETYVIRMKDPSEIKQASN
jgi:hypothetical protein